MSEEEARRIGLVDSAHPRVPKYINWFTKTAVLRPFSWQGGYVVVSECLHQNFGHDAVFMPPGWSTKLLTIEEFWDLNPEPDVRA